MTTYSIQLMPTNLSIPEDFVLDVHNLASIILDTHARTEVLFSKVQLLEVNRGDKPLFSLPPSILPPQWYTALVDGQQRVLFILKSDSHAAERTTVDTFASPEGVKTSDERELTRRDVEDIFWRCKTFNGGYLLAYVAQRVFDSLPPTATLRVRNVRPARDCLQTKRRGGFGDRYLAQRSLGHRRPRAASPRSPRAEQCEHDAASLGVWREHALGGSSWSSANPQVVRRRNRHSGCPRPRDCPDRWAWWRR